MLLLNVMLDGDGLKLVELLLTLENDNWSNDGCDQLDGDGGGGTLLNKSTDEPLGRGTTVWVGRRETGLFGGNCGPGITGTSPVNCIIN